MKPIIHLFLGVVGRMSILFGLLTLVMWWFS